MDDGRWVTFAGGVLLGTAIATGSAYLALKYAPSLVPSVGLSESSRQNLQSSSHTKDASNNGSKPSHWKRRAAPQRTSSPASRLMTSRRSNGHLPGLQQDNNYGAGAPVLSRTLTSDMYYYQTPTRDRDHHEAAASGHSRPQHQSVAEQAHGSNDVMTQNGSQHTAARRHTSANGHRANPFSFDGQAMQDEYTGGETDVGTHNANFRDIPSETDGGNTNTDRGDPVVYAGPADRANFAVQEALRHTAYNPSSFGQHSHHNSMASPSATNSPTMVKGHLQSTPMSNTPLFQPGASGRAQYPHESPSPATSASGRSPAHLLAAGGHQNSMTHSANPLGTHSLPHVSTADALATEGRIIEDAALHEQYAKVITPETPQNEETEEVCWLLHQALEARKRWAFKSRFSPEQLARDGEAVTVKEALGCDPFEYTPLPPTDWKFRMVDGVVQIYDLREAGSQDPSTARSLFPPPGTASEFFSVMHWLLKISAGGSVRSYTHHRLQLLEQKFNLHVMLNADKEFLAQKSAPHRDFYNVRKVDTHVHHSACMHQKHLLRFIKSKLKKEGDEVVIFRDGKYLTLKEVFESLNLTPYDLSVDTLDVHADKNIFHRFDKFNLKYNPFGQSRLREIFIKQDNLIHGRYLAEVTREVFADLEASKYQHTEYRISVYGRKPVEWDTLAAWVVQNRLYSDNNVWMIQVPRLFNVYKAQGLLDSFQQLLDNIFLPLFEATLNPESHPMLHVFLRHVSGFDLVDDESKPERKTTKQMPTPAEWTSKHNPAYAYYMYYMYANLHVLNQLREHRGLNTFALRPHCGEAGDLDHLAAGFLLTENIAHGINLRKSPALQFLFYLAQIGLCMSPLSNNSLFLDYHRNPFPQFFARGLPVSLSTDDPLQIHLTREPLVEEYSVAAQVWKLSGTDLCEVARNSVLHSGFPHRVKMHWVHDKFWLPGPDGNNIQKTNVPALRMCFRRDCHVDEMRLILHGAAAHATRVRHEGSGAES